MLHLTYSNRTEILFDRFAADLERHRRAVGPLEPVLLVLPSRNVEVWLRRALAQRDGIAANLEVLYLRRFIAGLVARSDPSLRLVDSQTTLDALLGLLLDDRLLAAKGFEEVRGWLHGAGQDASAVDLRRVQLATELARLFEEYAYSRPDMLASWAKGRLVLDGAGAGVEAWQSAVWRAAFGKGGLLEERARRTDERFLLLHELLEHLGPEQLAGGRPVFLFGLSYVASLFQRVLAALSHGSELFAYTLNPCLEFWEDVASVKELRRRQKWLPARDERMGPDQVFAADDPFGLAGGDTPALVLWGRPGRENVRLLNELSSCDFDAAFEETAEHPTLLQQLQRDVLLREPERDAPHPSFDFRADTSLRLLACPNAQREAEAIAAEIVALIQKDERERADPSRRLRFSDIAVLAAGPNPAEFFSHVESAFSQSGFEIPFSLEEGTLASPSRVTEAAGLLLRLPLGRFTRSEVLGVVTHPAVAGRFPDLDPGEWAGLADRLGIFRGADQSDLAGTYLQDDLHNWDQGLRRLALGRAMAGTSGEPTPVAFAGRSYLVEEIGETVDGSAARFGVLVRSLIHDARWAARAELDAKGWSALLSILLETYLAPRDEEGQRELERCLQAVRSLGELDLGGRKIGYRIAAELARGALAGLSGRRPGHSGVSVSTFQPMRALPFRVIFVAGLGEGRFPSTAPRDSLDLRLARPRPGDVDPREQDQYMFLEALLCARERLCLSYVARNELTGDRLQPSPVVGELLRIIRRGYLPWGEKDPCPLVREVRLRRFDEDPASVPLPPEARIEAQLVGVRRHLESKGVRAPDPAALRQALPEPVRPEVEKRLMLPRPPSAGSLVRAGAPLHVSLATLRKFLECPLQAGARFQLRLEEDEDDRSALDDEPFDAPRLERSGLRKEVFEALARAGSFDRAEALLGELAFPRQAGGRLPVGIFHDLERAEHLKTLGDWRALLDGYLLEAGIAEKRPEILTFGKAGSEESDAQLDPLVLEVPGPQPRTALVSGRTGLLFGGRAHAITPRARSEKSSGFEGPYCLQESLAGFLDHVALCASGQEGARTVVTLLRTSKGEASLKRFAFSPIPRAKAAAYLASLVEGLVSSVHDYLLPAVAVFRHLDPQAKVPVTIGEAVELALEDGVAASLYGPIHDPEKYRRPADVEAQRLITQRFGLYLESRIVPAESPPEEPPAAPPKKSPRAKKKGAAG